MTLVVDAGPLVASTDIGDPRRLADLSVVVMAARLRCTRILTFDERHFRAIRPLHGEAFTLLPADG